MNSCASNQMTTPTSSFKKWFIVLSAGMYFFYEYIQMTIFNAIPQQLLQSFHITTFELGKLSASYFIVQLILLFPAGIFLDRFSIKKIILIAMAISLLGTILFSYAHTIQLAMIARSLSGIGGAFAFLCCIKLAAEWMPNKISFATGVLVTLAVSGGFFAQTPFAYLADHTTWRFALKILAAFGVIIWINIALTVRNQPKTDFIHHSKSITHILKDIRCCLNNFQTILVGLYIALMNLPVFLFGALWGGLYLEKTHHLSNLSATFTSSQIFVGIIVGSPLFGWIAGKYSHQKKISMLMAAGFSLAVIILIITVNTNNLVNLSLLFLLLGIFSSAQCIGYPIIIENNKIELAATATSIASLIIMGLGAFIKVFYGWILSHAWHTKTSLSLSSYSLHAFQAATLILPTGFILAIVVIFLISSNRRPTDRILKQAE